MSINIFLFISCSSESEDNNIKHKNLRKYIVSDSTFTVENSKMIKFSKSNLYYVTMSSKKGTDFEKEFKLSIFKKNGNMNQLIWESELVEGYLFEKFDILKSSNNALITSSYNLGGAHALTNYFVINLDKSGNIKTENNLEQYGWIELIGKSLTIYESNQNLVYKIKKNKIVKSIVTRDNMSPPNSVKAYFKIENKKIVGINNILNVKVNENIAIIPVDDYSRSRFINGGISIYNIENNDFSLCEANRIKYGNSCQFYEKGVFQIVLCYDCDNPSVTFTVNVQ